MAGIAMALSVRRLIRDHNTLDPTGCCEAADGSRDMGTLKDLHEISCCAVSFETTWHWLTIFTNYQLPIGGLKLVEYGTSW